MAKNHSVILVEFNELTPSLMTRFMGQGKLPNFQRFYRESQVYITDAGEDPPNLNPWIQWVTVHSGLPFGEHKVFYLDDGHKLEQKCVWDLLSDAQFRVWVCGSMNIRYDVPINGAVLPDPWSAGVAPYPNELHHFYRFIQRNVQEHTNDDVSFDFKDYLSFLTFMATHGLSVSTCFSIVRQLLRERGGRFRWKRTEIMDNLQWDLFSYYYRKIKPHFSTFFINSTAHFQHCYWREMEPSLFKVQPTPEERAERENAILFGYQKLDQLIGRLLELAGDQTTLVFCTALSQQPCLAYEEQGGKRFFRPKHFEDLLALCGVTSVKQVAPVMSEEFQLRFETERDTHEAAERLRALRVGGRSVMLVEPKGCEIYTGCELHDQVPQGSVLTLDGSARSAQFFDIFYEGEGIKSGMHHRDGLLWVRRPDRMHTVHEKKVSLCAITPTVLKIFDVKQPESMREAPLY